MDLHIKKICRGIMTFNKKIMKSSNKIGKSNN